MWPFVIVLALGATSALPDSATPEILAPFGSNTQVEHLFYPATISFAVPDSANAPSAPDCYRYRVGFFRKHLVNDFVMTAIVLSSGDTLGANMTISEMMNKMQNMPDSTSFKPPVRWVVRYEQKKNGAITRGPIFVQQFNEDRLQALNKRWKKQMLVIPPPVVHPPSPSR